MVHTHQLTVVTHQLTVVGPLLTKRYTSWGRDEHRREWSVLRQVHRYAPDLCPRPVTADLDAHPPTVTMTVLPGEPLADNPTPAQVDALATALDTLWAVPHHDLPATGSWGGDLDFARRLTGSARPPGGVAAAAHDAATRWWHGCDPALLSTAPSATVLGHRDPNLANYLWDGQRIRIVDFEDAAVSDRATELAILVEHPVGPPARRRSVLLALRRRRRPPAGRPQVVGDVLAVAAAPRWAVGAPQPAGHRRCPGPAAVGAAGGRLTRVPHAPVRNVIAACAVRRPISGPPIRAQGVHTPPGIAGTSSRRQCAASLMIRAVDR